MTDALPSSLGVKRRKSSWSKWVGLLVVLGAGGAGAYWYFNRENSKPAEYRAAKISRGDITQTVTANGQLTPVKNVQVGSQISGTITEISADFNSKVKKGELIAKIDPATYERNLSQAEAELANATAAQELADLNFKRAKELFANKLISEADYNRAEVDLHQAQAIVKMRQANVERAKVDLERTRIFAPIDGIVISRNIEEGQTVAASFNTPTLFLIANDLAKMQIEAAVSEADVGGVQEGQPVNFTVEAYTRQFKGQVKQVRFAPITNQNVVTYTAIVEVDNPDLKLRPGMTATASIITSQKKDTLRVPNAAFRFRPPEGAIAKTSTNAVSSSGSSNQIQAPVATSGPFAGLPTPPWMDGERRRPTQEEREKYEASLTPEQRDQYRQIMDQMRARFAQGGGGGGFGGGGLGGGGPGLPAFGSASRTAQEGPRTQTVYVLEKEAGIGGGEEQVLRAVSVKTGITDGTNTEILEGLKEGEVVVTGLVTPEPSAMAMRPPGGGAFGGPFGGGPRRF
ncbi:MAG: efflux RND transporter periplasmic adaptor subunit [Verrucomicrobia bacterium]|nr:efflux RND transporter periplasmic adaptor subunit [Verrucomicrobiota bacterium]